MPCAVQLDCLLSVGWDYVAMEKRGAEKKKALPPFEEIIPSNPFCVCFERFGAAARSTSSVYFMFHVAHVMLNIPFFRTPY